MPRRHPIHKATLRDAINIRRDLAAKISAKELAVKYNVDASCIYRIGRSDDHPPRMTVMLTDELCERFIIEAERLGVTPEVVAARAFMDRI